MPCVKSEPAAGERHQRLRVSFADGEGTSLHVARFARAGFEARLVVLSPPAPLLSCCREREIRHAIVGGFFIRAAGTPLGELRLAGRMFASQAFDGAVGRGRACVRIDGGGLEIAPRAEIEAEPRGDLLQAGPMLVAGGADLIEGVADPEGFAAGSAQFDSDITVGRYPRAALGIDPRRNELVAVVCDGRSAAEAGMSLGELAATMIELGVERAINLDGGGSASLVVDGELVNVPREEHGLAIEGGRPVSTAIAFAGRD